MKGMEFREWTSDSFKRKLPDKYDACWWTINGAASLWKSGKVSVTLKEKMAGINIYMFGSDGGDKINPVKSVTDNN